MGNLCCCHRPSSSQQRKQERLSRYRLPDWTGVQNGLDVLFDLDANQPEDPKEYVRGVEKLHDRLLRRLRTRTHMLSEEEEHQAPYSERYWPFVGKPTVMEERYYKRHQFVDNRQATHPPVYNLWLVGAKRSGKSTLFRDFQLLYDGGFSDEERRICLYDYHYEVMLAMQAIWRNRRDVERDELEFPFTQQMMAGRCFEQIIDRVFQHGQLLTADELRLLYTCWKTKTMYLSYKKCCKQDLLDGSLQLLNVMPRYCDPNYLPSETDILHLNSHCHIVTKCRFKCKDWLFTVTDIQGDSMKKATEFYHFLDDVHALLFVIGLTDYVFWDPVSKINRIDASLEWYYRIAHNPLWSKAHLMLLFNKCDYLFPRVRRSTCFNVFPDWWLYVCQDMPTVWRYMWDRFKHELWIFKIRLNQDLWHHFVSGIEWYDMLYIHEYLGRYVARYADADWSKKFHGFR